jgi:formylglycine-generating enzyme required for sulfatase activity
MRFIWIFVLLWAGFLRAQSPVRCRGPLSEERLVDLIQSHVPEARIELFITTCGISFEVDGAAAARLRAAGAPAAIVSLLRKTPPKKVPVIEEFAANPRTVAEGAEVELRWRVKDADNVEVLPGIGSVSAEGSRKVMPQSTTAYTLVAAGGGGQKTSELTVEVRKPPVIEEFSANPQTILEGAGVELKWRVKDADSVEVQPGIGRVPAEGSRKVVPQATTAYKLVAAGGGGQKTSELTVEVRKPPVIEEFSANPQTIFEGAGVELRWRVKDADSVEVQPGIGRVPAEGSRKVVQQATTTYKLVAAGAGGQKTSELTVEVAKPPRIVKFEANPASIPAGGETTLSWQVENADSVEIDDGVGQVSATGSRAVKPVSSGNYTVTARRLGVEAKGTAQVQVLGPALAGESRIEFVRIPAGEFPMGSENGDADEKPVHRVRITKAFEIGKYEVTQAQWGKVMGNNPSQFKGPDLPVESVSWGDIQDFLQKLNAMNDGYRYRLPTEAEWEYAARAGSTGDSEELASTAWYDGNSDKQTHPVGTKRPNAWGLYDMLGSVWEWCQDWYDESYYRSSPEPDPPGPGSGQARVIRGGSWLTPSSFCRAASRSRSVLGAGDASMGFRLVREGGPAAGVAKPPDALRTVTNRIPSLNATVVGLRFFESGKETIALKFRSYQTRFRSSRTRYLNWELELSYPAVTALGRIPFVALWYKPDGSVLIRQSDVFHPQPGWTHSFHSLTWGSEEGGAFAVGQYRVDILVEGQIVARGTFEVF